MVLANFLRREGREFFGWGAPVTGGAGGHG
jgi:hypothetical protein